MFDVFFLAGVFIAAMCGAYWLLDRWDIHVNFYRYMDLGGIMLIFLSIALVFAFGFVVWIIRSIFS